MSDIREEWFFKEWYTTDELQQLWEWCQEAGEYVTIEKNNGKWSGFHILDKNRTIDIAGQPTKNDCENWMQRLGFKIEIKPLIERDGSHVHLNMGDTEKLDPNFKTSGEK